MKKLIILQNVRCFLSKMRIGLDLRVFRVHQLIVMANTGSNLKEKEEKSRKISMINAATGCGVENAKYFFSIYPDVYAVIFEVLKREYKWFCEHEQFEPRCKKFVNLNNEQKKLSEIETLIDASVLKKGGESLKNWLHNDKSDPNTPLSDLLEKKIASHFGEIFGSQFVKLLNKNFQLLEKTYKSSEVEPEKEP